MRRGGSISGWLIVFLLSWSGNARAERQLRPGVGLNVAQNATIDAPPQPSGSVGRVSWGADAALIGNIFGVEADFSRRSGFLPSAEAAGAGIVLSSSVTTLTGNVTVALPSHLVEYTLRPYFVGGAGLMAVRIDQASALFNTSLNLNAMDIGGGVTGFLTKRIGLNWDVRHFRNIGESPKVVVLGQEQRTSISFWRAQMALAIRY
jgi:hypothetical protein